MPFKSEKQRRYLHANHPEIAKRWERDYADGGITRIPFFTGAQADTKKGKAMSPGTSASGGTRHGGGGGNGGGDGPPSVINKPTGPTPEEIAAAKAKAEAEKRRLEAEARKKYVKDFKDTQTKKVKHKSNIRPFGFTEYEKLIKPGLYDHYKKNLPSYDSEGQELRTERVLDNLNILTNIKKGGKKGNIEETLSPFGQTFQTFDYEYDPYKPTQENFWEGYNTLVTPVATFNTMEDLKNIKGATKEKMFSSDHKLTGEGKNLGKFIESSKKLHGSQNPITGGGTIENIKSWMTDDKRQNIYKDYLNESGTDFNETIKDAIDKGLFEKKEDFTEQVNILEVKDGGPIRKKYSTGSNGILDITGEEEITTEEGNDISLVDESETGVSTLFMKKGGRVPLRYGGDTMGGPNDKSNDQGETSSDSGWSPGVSHSGMPSDTGAVTSDAGWDNTVTTTKGDSPDPHGGDWSPGWLDDATRKGELKDTVNNWEKEWGKWDKPLDKYSYTAKGVKNRANLIDKTYNEQRKELEKQFGKNLITKIALGFLGVPISIELKDIKAVKSMYDLEKQYKADMQNLKDISIEQGWADFHHAVDTPMQTIEQLMIDTITVDRDEDTGDGGPEAPVVAPVTEEIEDSYAMAGNWLQTYKDLKAKQALSASLQEKWADEREWQQNTMFANSGGLANLFRVKN